MGDEVDDFALTLNTTTDRDHAGGKDHAAIFIAHLGPDDEIGDAGLILQGDEHDALGAARPLADEHEAGGFEPPPIAGLHGLGAGDDTARRQVGAKEGDGMLAQRQADMAVILHHLAPGGHVSERVSSDPGRKVSDQEALFVSRHAYFTKGDDGYYYWDYQKMRLQYGILEYGLDPAKAQDRERIGGLPAALHPWCMPDGSPQADIDDLVAFLLTL